MSTSSPQPKFTEKQGQYLAFIHAYTLVNGRPPAEADMMRFFRATPPRVHQIVLSLGKAGLISRQPGVPPEHCPPTRPFRPTRAESQGRPTSQNHYDEVLVAARNSERPDAQ